jgi:putative glycosyltransferase (TIGR04372 family)
MIDSSSNYLVKHFGTQPIYYINQLWEKRAPLLKLNTEDENWSEIAFNELGIQNKWYICIHVREGGFLPHNEEIQSHRNATIENMHLAIKEITDRGGLVVRMGDPSMTRLFPKLGVIDYAHHALKSDRLDVILCAKAKFFLGCTSGLAFLSMVFGVPIAHANMIPIETLGIRYCDLSIPKLLINNVNNEYLNFSEIFRSKLAGYFYTNQYKEANITYLENTPDEILNLTKEMLDRLENKFIETDEGIDLHQKYMNFFKMGHYSYGAISKVNIAFLKKYQHLI